MKPTDAPWAITTKCRWCAGNFVKIEIDHQMAWLCESEACRERQLQWKITDIAGKLLYCPLPVQVEFEEAIASQKYGAICIGGHRSSSKSIALRMATYRAARSHKEFTALFLRREWSQIDANQMRFAEREAPRLGAEFKSKRVKFPDMGSEIRFGHAQDPNDWEQYIGYDVDLIDFEQVELFTQKQFAEISAATGRSTKYDDWRGVTLSTENPGGPLSDFVNQLFVRKDLRKDLYPQYAPEDYHFIESRLEDNPYSDARYEQKLAILSPARREMFRHGRRDVFEGQFFDEFATEKHVTPYRPVVAAQYFRALRFGYNREGFVLWIAVESSRKMTVAAVLPLEKLNEDAVAARIAKIDTELGVHPRYTVANPEIFGSDPSTEGFSGQTIAETLGLYGCPVICGDPDVVNGWKRLHSVLRDAPDTLPWLRVHDSCAPLIQALQQAMSDEKDPDLIDDDSPNLYALEALRLAMMSRPAPELAPATTVYPEGTGGWYLERAKREARSRVA